MKIMFIKPALEIDATWDPIRTCSYLGIWYMASLLKEHGHNVIYLDEAVRDGGLNIRSLFIRELKENGEIVETPIEESYETFQAHKMSEFDSMTIEKIAEKYSSFLIGVTTRIIARVGQPEDKTLDKVKEFNPDIVGIPLIASANYLPATRLAAKIRQELPKVKIIFGGQHVSANPEAFLEDNPAVNQVVTGDAISVIEDIVNGEITDKVVYGGFKEMDEFPFLNPEIIAKTNYPTIPNHTPPTNGRKWVDFMVTRGCFRKCSFCVAGCTPGCHVTTQTYSQLDKQLAMLKEAGYEELVIQDDAFLWDKRHIRTHLPAVLTAIKKHGFKWQSNGGIDFESLTDWAVDQIIESGTCTALYVPFNPRIWNKYESASHSMIGRYHDHLENLKRLRKAGIFVFTSAIIGTPEMDLIAFEDELATDKALVEEGYLDLALPLSATMLPGTEWYRDNGANIVRKDDWSGYSLFTTHHKTDHLSEKEIETLMIRWYKEMKKVQKNPIWGCAFPSTSF